MGVLLTVLEQGLIFGILALGVYLTYKVLDFADLSVEGTFPLGAAITALLLTQDVTPLLAVLISFLGGMLAGAVTGILHVKLKITNLLSGILVMSGLYSINLRIMGKANIPLFNEERIFSGVIPVLLTIVIIVVCVKIIVDLFLKTKFGFMIKATGDNPQLVTTLGVNLGWVKIVCLMVSNGLVALAGSLSAQYQGFADVGMGTGTIVIGLAAVIFGEAIFKKARWILPTTMAIIGAILYQGCTAIALQLGFPATDLKLLSALIVTLALALNNHKIKAFPMLLSKTSKPSNIKGGIARAKHSTIK
ncbi:ABC transporter permease [Turicibacter bilis]|uniref:ABC transporter permease n=1 Tax=Turicibacter bilis TaxID=2735723 RepID=UPI001B70E64D|nr:ABC transporter permease [Turicibacter sp.]